MERAMHRRYYSLKPRFMYPEWRKRYGKLQQELVEHSAIGILIIYCIGQVMSEYL